MVAVVVLLGPMAYTESIQAFTDSEQSLSLYFRQTNFHDANWKLGNISGHVVPNIQYCEHQKIAIMAATGAAEQSDCEDHFFFTPSDG